MKASKHSTDSLNVIQSKHWNILYRGRLSSCNYGCPYCPFAKTSNTKAELAEDRMQLNRFVKWAGSQVEQSLGVFFTPWGEALIHHYYRSAIIELSHLPHVHRVAIQTNLSCSLSDFELSNKPKVAFWATFHPGEVSLERFLQRCQELNSLDLRYSVGVVGLKKHFGVLEQLRARLDQQVYLWVNAYKREPGYYTPGDIELIRKVDPYFDLNRHYYPSDGKACHAGETSFTVDGEGNIRRCHFIKDRLGNIYDSDFENALKQRTCSNATCGCHIGYIYRPELKLDNLYGESLLERIPESWPDIDQRFLPDGSQQY